MTDLTSDKAFTLRHFGIETAATLRDACRHADPEDRRILQALSHRIYLCNAIANTWLAENLHNPETGDLFDGYGRYWHCGSKLCSYCLRQNTRRNRTTLKTAIENQKLHTGEHYRFVTFTLPNIGLNVPDARAIVNRAWSLLRKRLFFRRCFVGGAKAEEFTVTPTGPHYHLHVLARSKHFLYNKLRREWTDAVATAFSETPYEFIVPTSDNLLMVNVKIVHDLKKVSNEVCKYITKSNSWSKVPTDELIKIALIPIWHRMFEMFGTFRHNPRIPLAERQKYVKDATAPLRSVPDPDAPSEPRNHWRVLLAHMPLVKYINRLNNEYLATIERRKPIIQLKFPFATITTLDSS